jgi:hypothetical protein
MATFATVFAKVGGEHKSLSLSVSLYIYIYIKKKPDANDILEPNLIWNPWQFLVLVLLFIGDTHLSFYTESNVDPRDSV